MLFPSAYTLASIPNQLRKKVWDNIKTNNIDKENNPDLYNYRLNYIILF